MQRVDDYIHTFFAAELRLQEEYTALALLLLGAFCCCVAMVRHVADIRSKGAPVPLASPRDEEAQPSDWHHERGRRAEQPPAAGGAPKRGRKQHVFVIVGADYYQKQCKLSARTVTSISRLHAAMQELFAQELFAQELLARGGGSRRLLVAEMEMQYLDDGGQPTLVSPTTPIEVVLGAAALLLSDRPVAEMVALGGCSEELHARSCGNDAAGRPKRRRRGTRLGGGARAQMLDSNLPRLGKRLLTMFSPAEAGLPSSWNDALQGAAEENEEHDEAAAETMPVPSAFFAQRHEEC